MGAASPEAMSFTQFTDILSGSQNTSNGPFPGSPPQKPGKHKLPLQTKVKVEWVPIGVECILDFHGLADRYRADRKDIPHEVAFIKVRPDHTICHMVLWGA